MSEQAIYTVTVQEGDGDENTTTAFHYVYRTLEKAKAACDLMLVETFDGETKVPQIQWTDAEDGSNGIGSTGLASIESFGAEFVFSIVACKFEE